MTVREKMTTSDKLPMALRTAYLIMHRRSDAAFAEHDITADQFVLLATLSRGEAMTQRELAARMPSDPSTVRAMLVLLESRGLVERTTHPTDSRARTVRLTRAGTKKFQNAWESGQAVRDQLVESLGENEADVLLSLLQRVSESLGGQVQEVPVKQVLVKQASVKQAAASRVNVAQSRRVRRAAHR